MAAVKSNPILAATAAIGVFAYYFLWKRTEKNDNEVSERQSTQLFIFTAVLYF